MTNVPTPSGAQGKGEVRTRIRAARRARDTRERSLAAATIADRVMDRLGLVSEVCCYLSMDTEPGTDALIARLHRDGVRVHVPRVEGTGLRWCEYAPGDALRESALGIREPVVEGVARIPAGADAVILPALAADDLGNRLGQGGGFYDRALDSVATQAEGGPLRIALVFDDEVLPGLPLESHDLRVDVIVTPMRTLDT